MVQQLLLGNFGLIIVSFACLELRKVIHSICLAKPHIKALEIFEIGCYFM